MRDIQFMLYFKQECRELNCKKKKCLTFQINELLLPYCTYLEIMRKYKQSNVPPRKPGHSKLVRPPRPEKRLIIQLV